MTDIAAGHRNPFGWVQGARGRTQQLRSALIVVAVLAITFPYVQILPLDSYTQPYGLLLAGVVLVVSWGAGVRAMPWTDLAGLASLALAGVLLFVLTCFPYTNAQEVKYLLNYLSPAIITAGCFTLLRWDRDLVAFVVAFSIMVWFWVAFAQAMLSADAMTFLLGQWGSHAADIAASGRGVIALAPEPTHHAFHMLVLGGTLALLGKHRWVLIFCVLDIFLFARSANGLLALGIALAAVFVIHRPRTAVALGIVGLALTVLPIGEYIVSISNGNRFLILLGILLDNPFGLIFEDYSTNIRVGGVVAGFTDSIYSALHPHGLSFDYWTEQRPHIMERFPFLFDISAVGIPSGYGVLLWQAGFLAVPFLWMSTLRIATAPVPPLVHVFVLGIPAVFLFQYYVSAPQFGLAYACAIHAFTTRSRA